MIYDPAFLAAASKVGLIPYVRSLAPVRRRDPAAVYQLASRMLADSPGYNAAILELVSCIQGNYELGQRFRTVEAGRRPFAASANTRPLDVPLVRFDGHTGPTSALASLAWPGLDHPVIASASEDETVRVWDPQHPDTELARFEDHTSGVWALTTLAWPGLDHQMIISGSNDETARVWHAPTLKVVQEVPLLGPAYDITQIGIGWVAIGTERGLIFFDFRSSH